MAFVLSRLCFTFSGHARGEATKSHNEAKRNVLQANRSATSPITPDSSGARPTFEDNQHVVARAVASSSVWNMNNDTKARSYPHNVQICLQVL